MIFVMLVFPVIMNATQYYIIDSFIKNHMPDRELIPDDDDERDHEEEFREDPSGSDSLSADEDAELAAKADDERKKIEVERVKRKSQASRVRSPKKPGLLTGSKDYDPMYDGESSPTVGSSSSERERLVRPEDSDDEGNRPPK